MSFASQLQELMGAGGLGVAELARKVPCDKAYISRLAAGQQRPSKQIAQRLDELLGADGALVSSARSPKAPVSAAAAGYGALSLAAHPDSGAAQPGTVPDISEIRRTLARLTASDRQFRAGSTRPRAFSLGVQAIGHAQAGEIDQACVAAHELAVLAARLDSGYVRHRLADVLRALQPYDRSLAVRCVREAAYQALTARPPSGSANDHSDYA